MLVLFNTSVAFSTLIFRNQIPHPPPTKKNKLLEKMAIGAVSLGHTDESLKADMYGAPAE